jgi:hypothetical protein
VGRTEHAQLALDGSAQAPIQAGTVREFRPPRRARPTTRELAQWLTPASSAPASSPPALLPAAAEPLRPAAPPPRPPVPVAVGPPAAFSLLVAPVPAAFGRPASGLKVPVDARCGGSRPGPTQADSASGHSRHNHARARARGAGWGVVANVPRSSFIGRLPVPHLGRDRCRHQCRATAPFLRRLPPRVFSHRPRRSRPVPEGHSRRRRMGLRGRRALGSRWAAPSRDQHSC